ncbi:MAG: Uma2 family endonuclease [Minicystis sp.]
MQAPVDAPARISTRSPGRVTMEEWMAVPEEQRAELLGGRLVYQGMPGPAHGRTQGSIFERSHGPFDRRPAGSDRPGGWWISLEVDLELAGMGCRPDVVGWRRAKHAVLPAPDARGVVIEVPDWICEVLSPRTARVDMGEKRVGYHLAGVGYYWLADPQNATLTILRWTAEGYLVELVAGRGDRVRAAPFEAVEIEVGELFGEESSVGFGEDAPSEE